MAYHGYAAHRILEREVLAVSVPSRSVALVACAVCLSAWCHSAAIAQSTTQPDRFRLAIVGLVHSHVYGFLQSAVSRKDIEIVGIFDPSSNLLDRYGRHHHKFDPSILFTDLDRMLVQAHPQAVAVFTNTFDHPAVVEACARRGIHVMMEKPLAVSAKHAHAIQRAATEGRIVVLVNYETTWYPTTQAAWQIVKKDKRLGNIRRIVVHDGHQGPKEIGVPREFLDWLTDPVLNGGGALYDFGCYGTDLATWLLDDRRPTSVTAITQKLKSDPAYAHVDDEATIVLTYPDAQVIIQASWNWPYNRKDMEIYGERGAMVTLDSTNYRLKVDGAGESQASAEAPAAPMNDPISYLVAVARGEVVRGETALSGLSSLKTNVIGAEILDAARRSAETGRTVQLSGDAAQSK